MDTQELAIRQGEPQLQKVKGSVFTDIQTFENAQRMAQALCKSSLVPKEYKDNVPNTIIALEMAHRIGVSPFMVMQNLDIIHGKPSWRSTFIISALNSCGRFEPLRFEFEGERGTDEFGCRAWTYEKGTKNKIQGAKVDWRMVKAEGWLQKTGSKWKTMPELMFQYRAASFFGRLYAPDILTGMHSVEEIQDFSSNKTAAEPTSDRVLKRINSCTDLNDLNTIRGMLSEDLKEKYSNELADKELDLQNAN